MGVFITNFFSFQKHCVVTVYKRVWTQRPNTTTTHTILPSPIYPCPSEQSL